MFTFISNMARTTAATHFAVVHEIKFSSIIRGYHIYQSAWELAVGKELYGKHDSSPDAFKYDQFAVGLY